MPSFRNEKLKTNMGPVFLLFFCSFCEAFIPDASNDRFTCHNRIEINGLTYKDVSNSALAPATLRRFGDDDIYGLSFDLLLKDSSLYITGARICFSNGFDGEETPSTKVPLKIIFPETQSDTFPVSPTYTNRFDLFAETQEKYIFAILSFEKNKLSLYRFAEKSFDENGDCVHEQVITNAPQKESTERFLSPLSDSLYKVSQKFPGGDSYDPYSENSEYKNLFIRLKPYYEKNEKESSPLRPFPSKISLYMTQFYFRIIEENEFIKEESLLRKNLFLYKYGGYGPKKDISGKTIKKSNYKNPRE